MKKALLSLVAITISFIATAQTPETDSTVKRKSSDTIRVGNILIIKSGTAKNRTKIMTRDTTSRVRRSRIRTNYFVFDAGFANWNDNTSAYTGSYFVNRPFTFAPDLGKPDFKLRGGKSVNINVWFFMQKLALTKNETVNLKYGLGLELNNYRFRSPISFKEGGVIPFSNGLQTNAPFVFRDTIEFSKNKLAADYLTVPLMLNFATLNRKGKSRLGASFGVSAGYLYSQRNKQISDERGKEKNKGDYDLERFKLSYIGELHLGLVRFYGSYSPKSIFERDLNVKPFNIGVRFSNW